MTSLSVQADNNSEIQAFNNAVPEPADNLVFFGGLAGLVAGRRRQ